MGDSDNAAEVAAAEHVVNVLGGEFDINDTGAESGQYDVNVTTATGGSVALEVTSFGGDDWRRTAARVNAAHKRGSFAGDGLDHQWWVIFPSGIGLREIEERLTETLRRLEREGRSQATRRYDGDDATLGLMRAWLEILRERHPDMSWIAEETPRVEDPQTQAQKETAELVPAA
jgi:hypothetical protein